MSDTSFLFVGECLSEEIGVFLHNPRERYSQKLPCNREDQRAFFFLLKSLQIKEKPLPKKRDLVLTESMCDPPMLVRSSPFSSERLLPGNRAVLGSFLQFSFEKSLGNFVGRSCGFQDFLLA
ncbi:hypothetical protein VNO77_31441 [Canavalia gladiata]|uniref:Uncharacterized protein n=1 Tax=Canavalia gladiata TaxID=3824 RepID=A0AAN9KQD0_CANGL